MEGSEPGSGRYLFAEKDEVYLFYLPTGGAASLDLTGAQGSFNVRWFNPRVGGALQKGNASSVRGGARGELGVPPSSPTEDWLAVVRRR
jgi:Putative collagen-binding domain of a collagenase